MNMEIGMISANKWAGCELNSRVAEDLINSARIYRLFLKFDFGYLQNAQGCYSWGSPPYGQISNRKSDEFYARVTKIVNELETIHRRSKDPYQNKQKNFISEVKDNSTAEISKIKNEIYSNFTAEITKIKNETADELSAHGTKITNELSTRLSEINSTFTAELGRINNELNNKLNEEVNAGFGKINTELSAKLTAEIKKINSRDADYASEAQRILSISKKPAVMILPQLMLLSMLSKRINSILCNCQKKSASQNQQPSSKSSSSSGPITFKGISLTIWTQFNDIFDKIKADKNFNLEEMYFRVAMEIRELRFKGFMREISRRKIVYISTLDDIGLWVDSKNNGILDSNVE
ncbi:hypothetical protein C1646_748259 [Rhizophagus diaphanus]|nr:hypothetical protein C1646_748259 [Rhizophagus diaphanus] [Rhizophagus sp. MUCL 43196]